jgi:hypothetical protein
VHKWIKERNSALSAQQDLLDSKQMELISVEAQLRMAESELDFMADEKQVPCLWYQGLGCSQHQIPFSMKQISLDAADKGNDRVLLL